MTDQTTTRRVLLKLSGESFGGGQMGVDPDVVSALAREIAEAAKTVEVAIVVGGGNFFRGAELQQAVSELALDLAGPASLAARAGDDSPQEGWARRAAPTYLNLRKASIYGGSNEIQRQIISRTILGL